MKSLLEKILKNRYRVDESLGRGGMAEVYKVWDLQRDVPLAMKVLREDLAHDVVFLKRFEREAKTLSKLQHPNIVRFYGLEQDDMLVFMLMDYIEGESLREEIFRSRGKGMSLDRILEIMHPVCSALNYAHQSGIVHCDLKPGNILIDKNGKVFISDFGIARHIDASTSTMVGIGTPAYMAPELIKGQDPTPQTDIYALGIVLYEMLTGGERPFTGERATITGTTADKVRWEHLQLEPIPIGKYNPQVNSQIEKVVQCCLNKDAQNRCANVIDFLDELKKDIALVNTDKENYIQKQRVKLKDGQKKIEEKKGKEAGQTNKSKGRNISRKVISMLGIITLIGVFGVTIGIPLISSKRVEVNEENKSDAEPEITLISTSIVTATEISTPLATPTLEYDVGSTLISPIGGAEMMYIPAGEFIMGSDSEKDLYTENSEIPQHIVYTDAYWIDKYEVTVDMWLDCVNAGYCFNSREDEEHYRIWYENEKDVSVTGKTWYQAEDYCAWAGKRLPTEAEWEKAARGSDDDRIYIWGNTFDETKINCDYYEGIIYKNGDEVLTPFGVADMANSTWEWVQDYWAGYDVKSDYLNPVNLDSSGTTQRVVRGGGRCLWQGSPESIFRISNRSSHAQSSWDADIGFRCVLDAD